MTGTSELLATGDAVNVAARLEQAAAPGEILVGPETVRLGKRSVEVERVPPLVLKGKTSPVPAFRLLAATTGPRPQRFQTPFVGRANELATLQATWERVCRDRRCELVTVVGPAGLGKSRLAAELFAGIDGRVAQGRCLPYGEGITYWPVLEVLRQLADVDVDPRVAEALAPVVGSRQIGASEQIPWAARKAFEAAARTQGLAVLFDDIQWGEEGFLDVVEHVALLSVGSPILLICLARPELQDLRPDWPNVVRLEPLEPVEAARLIGDHLGERQLEEEMRQRIVSASGGNPLFVEEMVAMLDEMGGTDVTVPPTIHALLAARLDQLDPGERRVLERGAVEGEIFHLGAVRALADGEPSITARFTSLVRRGPRPPRADAGAGRRRVPLPPSAPARRRVRVAPEVDPRRPASKVRGVARAIAARRSPRPKSSLDTTSSERTDTSSSSASPRANPARWPGPLRSGSNRPGGARWRGATCMRWPTCSRAHMPCTAPTRGGSNSSPISPPP